MHGSAAVGWAEAESKHWVRALVTTIDEQTAAKHNVRSA
jgi:hypothetical protein